MVTEPESMDELVYFTNRSKGDGKVKAWVYRAKCPKCGEGWMGKPIDPKTGKIKRRSEDYVCPDCSYTVHKDEYEPTLEIEIKYICPHCKHEGETTTQYKRKKVSLLDEETGKKKPVDAYIFHCDGCGEKIPITKKMKG